MDNITFDFSDFHRHGSAFYEFLTLRKQVFVDRLGWSIPHNDQVEMDQYDTPVTQYSVVRRAGKVIGGARAMATSAAWGSHTYMLRDACSGKLRQIPPGVMSVEIASPFVWECTRLVISDDLRAVADPALCLSMIVDGLVEMARNKGATELISLSSLSLVRALRQLGFGVSQMGESYRNSEDGRPYAVLRMPATFSTRRRNAVGSLAQVA
jgi:N-acyl-L-homoserine lactone synthetase